MLKTLLYKTMTSKKLKIASSKDIVKAGLILGVGFTVLPFINFKDAKNYSPFKDNFHVMPDGSIMKGKKHYEKRLQT